MGFEENGVEEARGCAGKECQVDVSCPRSGKMSNGFANGHESDVGEGSSGTGEQFRTYKRRRHVKSEILSEEDERATARASIFLASQFHVPAGVHQGLGNCGCDCSRKEFSKDVLEQINDSLNDDGGVRGCIQNALSLHARERDSMKVKNSQFDNEHRLVSTAEAGCMQNRDAVKGADLLTKVSLNVSNREIITEMCQHAFFDIIISGKFSQLCKLLCENFPETKFDRLLDFHLINSKMKEGVYERSPGSFSSDILEVWRKLEEVGTELASLAKSLSEISKKCCEHFCSKDALLNAKLEESEQCGADNVCSCRQCGEKADYMECLVCDSCEEVYHISCIEPAVKEIPPRSWYCASCMESGITSTHENCVVCEKMNASRSAINGFADEDAHNMLEDVTYGSCVGLKPLKETKILSTCKICGNEIENGDKFRTCDHPFCPNKYYHRRCLTTKQLKSYSSRWYCPSCLCRACLTDRDDDKIVLCDGCDHAYHIYCMKPPRTSIPRGKWFCRKCDAGIQAIRRAKKAYETFENKQRLKVEDQREYQILGKKQNEKGDEDSDKGRGGMDMLLSAANTLNYEENFVGVKKIS